MSNRKIELLEQQVILLNEQNKLYNNMIVKMSEFISSLIDKDADIEAKIQSVTVELSNLKADDTIEISKEDADALSISSNDDDEVLEDDDAPLEDDDDEVLEDDDAPLEDDDDEVLED